MAKKPAQSEFRQFTSGGLETRPTGDFLSIPARSALMSRVRGVGDEPERLLAAALRRRGVSFSANVEGLAGRPDAALRRAKVAVFVDGELWHGAQYRRRGLARLEDQFAGSRDPVYWTEKIRGNVERDVRATAALLGEGWKVLRFWETDVRNDVEGCVAKIVAARDEARGGGDGGPSVAVAVERTVNEFFAGMGLMRMGLDAAGWRTVYANDFDANKRRLYEGLFGGGAGGAGGGGGEFDGRDINVVRAEELPTASLATASFPCVDLSLAGAQRGLGRGTRSGVYLRFIELLGEMGERKPLMVLLENVIGLLSSNGGRDFELCCGLLQGLGYSLDAFALNAAHFVPQSRARMFVVGTHEACGRHGEIGVDELEADGGLRPARLVEFMRSHGELNWQIRRLPAPPVREVGLGDIVEAMGEGDGRWWSGERVERFVAQMSGRHRAEFEERSGSGERSYATAFRRMRGGRSTAELRFDGVAGCLRTPKGGSAKQILVRMGGGGVGVRLLTAVECGRLMGVKEFALPEGMREEEALYGFGDAVCVPVVEWIARHYLDALLTEIMRGRELRPCAER